MEKKETNIDGLIDQGWRDMTHILDQEMPQSRRRFFLYRISAAVILLLLFSLAGYWWLNDSPENIPGNAREKRFVDRPSVFPFENNEFDENIAQDEGMPVDIVKENLIEPPSENSSDENGIKSANENSEGLVVVARKKGKGVPALQSIDYVVEYVGESENLQIIESQKNISKIANVIPITFSPLTSGKVNLSIKVNKHNDSTRVWPNARIKPSLFAGTVWVPTRSIGFLNLGGGLSCQLGDWSLGTGFAVTKFISNDFRKNQYVNLSQYDDRMNIVNNVYENQVGFDAQFGEMKVSSYTQVRAKWGFLLPAYLSWKPRGNMGYSIVGGVYFLRTQSRKVYTVASPSVAQATYNTKVERMPYLGVGINYSLGASYVAGIESIFLDPFTKDHLLALSASFSYQFE